VSAPTRAIAREGFHSRGHTDHMFESVLSDRDGCHREEGADVTEVPRDRGSNVSTFETTPFHISALSAEDPCGFIAIA